MPGAAPVTELPGGQPGGPRGGDGGDRFRPDLEGLRAVAVLMVLVYHAGLPGLDGGFVGVDVFFVLSGFLITGLILRELRRTGTVSLSAFYARRARRLLPAAAITLLVTVGVSAVVMPPLLVPGVAGDAASAALYASNVRFALQATDYLSADALPSPLLHYWSLGVEEQFYLFWPAFLLLVSTRWGGGLRRIGPAIVIVSVLSFVLAVWLTGLSAPWAFFSLPTRAWELGVGGLIAVGAPRLGRLPVRLATLAGWVGLGLVVASGVVIATSTPFPGTAAVLPVSGTALVVLAGLRQPAPSPSRLLSLAPMRFLGRISYSLYLWHWPIIVLPAAALGSELPLAVRVVLAAAAVPVAAASQRWVEDPIRRGRFVGLASRRTLALAGALTVTVAASSIGIGNWVAASIPGDGAGASSSLAGELADAGLQDGSAGAGDTTVPAGPAAPRPMPAPTSLPADAAPTTAVSPAATPAATADATPTATPWAVGGPVPANLRPPLATVKDDLPVIYRDGCHLDVASTDPPPCAFGDVTSARTVVLFGDSHAAQWFPALEALAQARGWRLLTLTKSACPAADATVYNAGLKRAYTECDTWREHALERIEAERPDLVIVSNAGGHVFWIDGSAVPSDDRPERWSAALGRTLARVERASGAVTVIGDTPRQSSDPPACLSRHLDDSLACATPRSKAVDLDRLGLDRAAADAAGAAFVDPTPWLCSPDTCPVVIGRYLVFRDPHHLTTPFAASLARRLEVALAVPGF